MDVNDDVWTLLWKCGLKHVFLAYEAGAGDAFNAARTFLDSMIEKENNGNNASQ